MLYENLTRTYTIDQFADQVKNELLILQTDLKSTSSTDDIVSYRIHLSNISNDFGEKKYPNLCRLAQTILCISHGNASPERDFSINKNMIDG